jgi:hypothetical protein
MFKCILPHKGRNFSYFMFLNFDAGSWILSFGIQKDGVPCHLFP